MPFITARDIPATPADVFAAIADRDRLARWWGPAGFSNSFEVCDFRPGGDCSYVMHGPGGKAYPNRSRFDLIEPARKLVICHVSPPQYRLTITLMPTAEGGTGVGWEQAFDDERVASGIAHIVEPANEENLDRLTAEVLHPPGAGG